MANSNLKTQAAGFGLNRPVKNLGELLLAPKIKETSVVLEIKPDVNLTTNALYRNGRALEREVLNKAGDAEVVILKISESGIDNAGYKFLNELDEYLKSRGKLLILLIEDKVTLKSMEDLHLPILVSSMTDAEKVTPHAA